MDFRIIRYQRENHHAVTITIFTKTTTASNDTETVSSEMFCIHVFFILGQYHFDMFFEGLI